MKKYTRFFVVVLLLTTPLQAQVLAPLAPEKVGLSKERLDRIRPAMEKHIAANQLAGGVALIARRGKVAYFETYGLSDKEGGKPMQKDSIFRIYSMTKAVTGVAVMILYEEGRFTLSDPVSKFLPEFANMKVAVEKTDPATGKSMLSHSVPAEHPITILDLMRHTSGLNYAGPHDEKGELVYQKLGLNPGGGADITLAEYIKRIAGAPLVHQPGTIWDYGYSIDVLARLVEAVSGQAIDQFFSERILKPLKMVDTSYYVPEDKWGRLVVMYSQNKDMTINRMPNMVLDAAKKKPALLFGGSGLFSTAMDYARFVQMLLNGGELDGVRVLGPKTVDLMHSDVLGDLPRVGILQPGYGFGLTFAVNRGPGPTASAASKGEYFWGGAAGTSFFIDPQEQMIGVLMIQTLGDLTKGQQFKQLAYQTIVEEEKKPEGRP